MFKNTHGSFYNTVSFESKILKNVAGAFWKKCDLFNVPISLCVMETDCM